MVAVSFAFQCYRSQRSGFGVDLKRDLIFLHKLGSRASARSETEKRPAVWRVFPFCGKLLKSIRDSSLNHQNRRGCSPFNRRYR